MGIKEEKIIRDVSAAGNFGKGAQCGRYRYCKPENEENPEKMKMMVRLFSPSLI